MDYREYKQLYNQLVSEKGRAEIGDDTQRQDAVATKVSRFLELYPSVIPMDRRPDATVVDISLREMFRRTIQTAIDIIQDLSSIISERDYISTTELRRRMFATVTSRERRVYVGIWLIFLSFVLYFIDSAT